MTTKWIATDVRLYPAVPYKQGFREIVLKEDYKQALAEKDREIQQIREHEFQRGYREREEAYQQLMEKAVRFAEAYRNAHLSNWIDLVAEDMAEHMATKDPVYVEAQAFLKEREGT